MYKKPIKFSSFLIISILLTLGLSLSFQNLLAQWAPPTQAPPQGNVSAPIYSGDPGSQQLGGTLHVLGDLSSGADVFWIEVANGVGIGTSVPDTALDIDGNMEIEGTISNSFGDLVLDDWVDILYGLSVNNNLSVVSGTISGNGSGITNIDADNIDSGTLSASLVENGNLMIDSAGTNNQVWTSDGIDRGYWADASSAWDHTATQNINMGTNWLSGDGDSEGIYIDGSGNVGIASTSPQHKLAVEGDIGTWDNLCLSGDCIDEWSDALPIGCTDGQIAEYNFASGDWDCGTDDAGGGAMPVCTDGQILEYNETSTDWECVDVGGSCFNETKLYGSGNFSSVKNTSDGGFIAAGVVPVQNIRLVKTDNQGNVEWETEYGLDSHWYIINEVVQTSDGGYVVVGSRQIINWYIYLAKFDSDGNFSWLQTQVRGGGQAVEETSDGGFIISGTKYISPALDSMNIVKTDSGGNFSWEQVFGSGNYSVGYDVQQTSDGGYIIAGQYWTGVHYQFYMVKTNSAGGLSWERFFGGPGADYALSVKQTADGGYVMAGRTDSYGAGNADVYVIKTDNGGTEEWSNTHGGVYQDYGYDIIQDDRHEYLIVGGTRSFGAGRVNHGSPGYENVYLVKLDSYGNEKWQRTYGSPRSSRGYEVQQAPDKGYIIAANYYPESTGVESAYLIKTNNSGDEFCGGTVVGGGGSGAGDGYSLDAADGNPTDVVYVDDDGEVGINGVADALHDLVVRDDNGNSSIYVWGDGQNAELALGDGSGTDHWAMYHNLGDGQLRFWKDSSNLIWFTSAGDVHANSFVYTSDASLKENVQTVPDALDRVLGLEGVVFNWIGFDDENLGLIAQDVEEVFPEAVVTDEVTGLKSVKYGNLIAPIIEAIKAQQIQIDELKLEIEKLKNDE